MLCVRATASGEAHRWNRPQFGKSEATVDLQNVYPYLVRGLFNPDWERIAVSVGHGVYAILFEDHESGNGIVHATVSPEALEGTGLTAEAAHTAALENLERFASSEAVWGLSMKMIGQPGEPINFLLISDHPRAAACLRLRFLYDQASRLLESTEVCACAPQRESLVVFPKRDREYREMIVGRLREIEADARRPISFELFELTRDGVRPFSES
jgi:hypothetical protein